VLHADAVIDRSVCNRTCTCLYLKISIHRPSPDI
jgi:hypothetical protein